MRVNLIYFSATDRTAKVVKEIGSAISNELFENDITLEENRNEGLVFTEKDLVIVGVPVYAGRVPKFLVEYFNKVKGNNTLVIFVVTYGNRAYEDALLELKNTFEENGFIGVGAAAFVGEHSYTELLGSGRPNKKDLEIAKKFGDRVKIKIDSIKDISEIGNLNVPGNYPYVVKVSKMKPMAPETNDNCIDCGICKNSCPTNAISNQNCRIVDKERCIKCCRCIRNCPVGAKEMTNSEYIEMRDFLINNWSNIYNSPEIYIY
ncbi:EFR1 family ferrodoxin [Clostridium gasigenes]|uniref:EFR1 family ferrodoxin n=1 Tax=Clostridium gasigenes TaxID=94869 RepID=UPI0014384020|nr:EFR1 family ferrodoxin [Clostridium gasigenes]NKF06781.1 4Fe-4S binding protein [Clostridium gasigenes]QSW19947.1 EFR1 family ferrodoxin [Clostridium gasigenes]